MWGNDMNIDINNARCIYCGLGYTSLDRLFLRDGIVSHGSAEACRDALKNKLQDYKEDIQIAEYVIDNGEWRRDLHDETGEVERTLLVVPMIKNADLSSKGMRRYELMRIIKEKQNG
jgi:hypothetical protein